MTRLSSIKSPIHKDIFKGMVLIVLCSQVCLAQTTRTPQPKPVLPNAPVGVENNGGAKIEDKPLQVADIDIKLPTLEQLTELAIENSEVLKQKDLQIKGIDEQKAMHKKTWFNMFSAGTSFSAGNQSVYAQQASGADVTTNISNGYRISIGANLPLYSLLTRRNTGKMLEYDKQTAVLGKEVAIDDIKRSVISQYYAVINARDVLKVAIQNKITSEVTKQMAEKDFSEGQISVTDMSQVVSAHASYLLAFENAKQNFMTSIRYLELLVGQRLY